MENISFFCRPSSTAAARAVVTGVKPALMGTSGTSGKIHPSQRWVERGREVPRQHPWTPMAAGASWQPGCPAGEVSLLWGDLTPNSPHRNPELFTWACRSSLQSTRQVSEPNIFLFPFPASLLRHHKPSFAWDCGQIPSPKNSPLTHLIENWTKNLSTP